jgi:hypothetical protein
VGGWGFSESVEILMENDYTMFFCYWEMLRIVGWMISTPRKKFTLLHLYYSY